MKEEKNNDPIESFFRDKVWNYDIPFEERDWEDLEHRLDKIRAANIRRRRRHLAAAVLALLLCALAYFTYDNYTSLNRLSEQLNEQQITGVESENDRESGRSTSQQSNAADLGNEDSMGDDKASIRTEGDEKVLASSSGRQPSSATGVKGGEEQPLSQWTITEDETAELYIASLECHECRISSFVPGNDLREVAETEPPASGVASVAVADSRDQDIRTNIEVRRGPDVALGFVVAPDLSTVGGLSNFESPGYKVGLTAEINLFERLAITTGIIHSSVNYRARGREYKPPRGYWSEGVVARQTFAQCALLDIPVSLKYDVVQFNRSRLYATAGISSYIMLSEDYRFRYDSYAPGRPHEWSEDTGTRHWLSNANFSVGYEWAVHPSWGIQIEPFIKLPLKEVGWGNVKLYSVGSFISLNYKLK